MGLQRHLRRRVEHLPGPDRSTWTGCRTKGHDEGRLLLPGTVADARPSPAARSAPPVRSRRRSTSTGTKTAYLREMQARRHARGRGGQGDLGAPRDRHPRRTARSGSPRCWTRPTTSRPASTAACGSPARTPSAATSTSLIDFVAREVRAYAGEKVRYRFRTRRAYVEQLIAEHEIDWVNSLFLSCRFSAHRIGPYNEFVYVFFKCLSEERLQLRRGLVRRAERRRSGGDDHPRRLGRAAPLPAPEGRPLPVRLDRRTDVLTCQMHGWKWRLTDGKCLTSVGHDSAPRPPASAGAGRADPAGRAPGPPRPA